MLTAFRGKSCSVQSTAVARRGKDVSAATVAVYVSSVGVEAAEHPMARNTMAVFAQTLCLTKNQPGFPPASLLAVTASMPSPKAHSILAAHKDAKLLETSYSTG